MQRCQLRGEHLDRLAEWQLVERSNGGRVALTREWGQSIRILAIEAKLADWRPAIAQAQQYLRYADEAYVALPSNRVDKLIDHSAFAISGIGLLSVNSHVEVRVAARASNTGHDWRREYAASRLLSSHAGSD
jgi:hypothetical protein